MALIEFGSGERNKKVYQQSNFKTGKQYCPVCEQTNDYHCGITEDGGLAYCKFKYSDKTDGFGRYLHILKNDGKSSLRSTNHPETVEMMVEIKQAVKANPDRLDKVYCALLENLELDKSHWDNLVLDRGLDAEKVDKNLYATVPSYNERYSIAQRLAESFNLEGIPGFYFDGHQCCLNMTLDGFYIPYRDEKGRIIGLQIRRDDVTEDKYMWVSSANREKGVSSGSPLHFVNVEEITKTQTVFLTEGALKADVIGNLEEIGLIASAGVGAINPEKLLDSIFSVFPDLGELVLAYDMDWETNLSVNKALKRLLESLAKRNVNVNVAVWDLKFGKGLDDVLLSKILPENTIRHVSALDFRAMLDAIVFEETENTLAVELVDEHSKGEQVYFEKTETEPNSEISNQEISQEYLYDENAIMHSWGELESADLGFIERVMFGLMRGNVGMLVAPTNLGKTTLALNLALSVTAGREFNPLYNQTHTAKRVLYIDGEATKPELQADLRKMSEVLTHQKKESVKKNLFLICDGELDDEPLDLVNPEHQEIIRQKALICSPDLIIVDTMSALMDIEDENDNAKVKKEVMKPLKKLARQTNSTILLLHHTGKYTEGGSTVGAYKGRGASAFGGLSRTVITLEEFKGQENCVKIICPKVKGEQFTTAVLKLDKNSRWFEFIENDKSKPLSNYEKVIEYVINYGNPVKRETVVTSFKGIISGKTVDRHLSNAVKNFRLEKSEYGFYSAPINLESELPLAS